MKKRWLCCMALVTSLACGSARANVTYTAFDLIHPSTIDLEFDVASQLSLTATPQTMTNVTGALASDYVGQSAEYLQGPPGHQPVIDLPGLNGVFGELTFNGPEFPFGDPSNGVPGNGNFAVDGIFFVGDRTVLASVGSVSIAGIASNAPEPSTWALMLVGFAGLGLAACRRARPIPSV